MPPFPFGQGDPQTRVIETTVGDQPVTIELPIRGALLAGEVIHIAAHRYQHAFNAEAGLLADALIGDGFEDVQAESSAVRILTSRMLPGTAALTTAERRAMLRHGRLIADAECRLTSELQEQQIRKATAAVRFRVAGQAGWSDADTSAQLPQPIIAALATFLDDERDHGIPQRSTEEIVEGMIADLGKLAPPPAAEPPPPMEVTVEASTGPTSSGEPAPSGPPTLPSAPSGSRSRRSTTSSRRSAAAKRTG